MTAGSPPPVYFFLHVPKTAGQTLAFHLTEHRPDETVWMHWRKALPASVRNSGSEAARIRAVIGHGLSKASERYFAGREIRRILLLREPLSLHISLYNYRVINNLVMGRGIYSFALHLGAEPRNFVAHWLLLHWLKIPWYRVLIMSDGEKYRILNEELSRFWFVSDYSDCNALLHAVSDDLDIPPAAPLRNSTREWTERYRHRPLTEGAMAPALRTQIRDARALDTALWENWRKAGFAASQLRPCPLEKPQRRSVFHDILTLLFMAARHFRRDVLRLIPFTRSHAHIRDAMIRAEQAGNRGDWREAADHYHRVLAIEPDLPSVWLRYGVALREAGDLAGAEQAYREAALRDADSNSVRK